MKEIICKHGAKVLVDDQDYPLLSQFKWKVITNHQGYKYAEVTGHIAIHRGIMGVMGKPALWVDHIDGNGLNNQRTKLRTCTRFENKSNQKVRNNNTSGYKGVHKLKK